MFDLASICRTVGGMLAIVFVGFILYGCSANTTQPLVGDPVTLTTTMADPAPVTDAVLAGAAVKPANPADAIATLDAPTLETTAGSAVTMEGAAPKLDIDLGNTGAATGSLALKSDGARVTGGDEAALPAGDHALRLGGDTAFDIDDEAELLTRGLPCRLRITGFDVLFSVHRVRPPSWTLPNSYRLNLQKQRRNRTYILDGSLLTLRWKGRVAGPPADGKVTLTVNLYRDTKKVAGPLTKTVPVVNNVATFTSETHVEFNRADVKLDVRDKK